MNRKIAIGGVIALILVVLGIVLCAPNEIKPVNGSSYGITVREFPIPSGFGDPILAYRSSSKYTVILFEGGFVKLYAEMDVRYEFVYTD